MKNKLYEIVDACMPEIQKINEYIFDHPELGNEEFLSSQYLVDILKKHGFHVIYPYLDMPTAFMAEFKHNEGKKVAFLAEYDALPGYENGNGHACGHNWISATCVGAAICLSKLSDFSGSVIVIGTPAEETTGGKCELVQKGAFQDIDACIQMHLGAENNIEVKTLAMDSYEFNFKGVASHSAAYPENGINALDAVQLMFAGINALRQHIRSNARIAGIVTNGGTACNIVPDFASCRFYIRATTREYVNELTQKIINCAKGACLMTGCTVEYHTFENHFDQLTYDAKLQSMLKQNLMDLGITHFIKDEAAGSSDIGNVSQVCPCVYCEIETGANPKVYAHEKEFLDYVHGKNSEKTLNLATKAMAYTAYQVLKEG